MPHYEEHVTNTLLLMPSLLLLPAMLQVMRFRPEMHAQHTARSQSPTHSIMRHT